MTLRLFFLGAMFCLLHVDGRRRIKRATDCYSFNERVVKLYKSLGCVVEAHLPSCYKPPICPDGCTSEDRKKHVLGDVWLDEGGSLKCSCLTPSEYWKGHVPPIPTGGVIWPPARKCQYIGCPSKHDTRVIIKPNTVAKVVDEICYCRTEGKDASGWVEYTLYCIPA